MLFLTLGIAYVILGTVQKQIHSQRKEVY